MSLAVPGYEILREIFPHISIENIDNIIQMIEEQTPNDTYEGKMENMINLLSGHHEEAPIQNDEQQNLPDPEPIGNNGELYQNLLTIFPDASERFLLGFCQDLPDYYGLDQAIDDLSINGYEKKELDPIEIWEQLKQALPNADPSYLRDEANQLALLSQQDINNFVENAVEKGDYPTMQEYLKHKKEVDNAELYKSDFKVEKFLEVVPNPVETFSNPERKLILNENSPECDINYALDFLQNQYPYVRMKYIEQLFNRNKNLVIICNRLDRLGRSRRIPRAIALSVDTNNIELLQLVAYLKHRKMIKNMLKLKDDNYRRAKEEARKYNLLETCQCCFDDELIPEECYFCMKNCVFCKDCVRRGAENIIGSGELRIPCFAKCESEFGLQTLQMILPQNIFQRLSQKISSEEIKKANVEGLAACPFCDFAMILPDNEKIFKCENEDCLMESCRECHHKSHIPLRCNEIEYDEDVRRRTYIEDKMTEALTRTCYNCNKTFIKTSGCNKMTCQCGAKMCFLCRKAINDYTHFGAGGCALHTNDSEVILNEILQNAQQAKEELGNVEIKFDPTNDIREFY